MNAIAEHDTLTIINGPEDGTEFPLTQRSITAGSDSACAVNVRLDDRVSAIHGRIVAVGDGYRVRAAGNGRVTVNDKRVGVVLSRVLRHGDVIRLGETDLALTCNAGGLAQRSRGTRIENDLFWAVREGAGALALVARRGAGAASFVWRTIGRHPIATGVFVLAIAYWRMPAVHAVIEPILQSIHAQF